MNDHWEYLVETPQELIPDDKFQAWLNEKGKQCWDLVLVRGNSFIFKRRLAVVYD